MAVDLFVWVGGSAPRDVWEFSDYTDTQVDQLVNI